MTCTEARSRLQDLHDTGQALEVGLERHLAGCEACSGFQAFLRRLGGEARQSLDAAAAGLPLPCYPAIFARAEAARKHAASAARRVRLAVGSMAAVFVACAGITAGVLAHGARLDRAKIAVHVGAFVNDLFAHPLLADAEYQLVDNVTDLRSWLENPGTRTLP